MASKNPDRTWGQPWGSEKARTLAVMASAAQKRIIKLAAEFFASEQRVPRAEWLLRRIRGRRVE